MGLVDTAIGMAGGHGAANSALGNLGRAAGSYANKIKSLTNKYDSPLNIRDIYTNGFLPGIINSGKNSVKSAFAPKFFARAYDEPTYLTFRVEFIFEDAIRNRVYNNNDVFYKSLNGILPTYDFMPEPFLEDSVKVTNTDNEGNNEKVEYFEGVEQTQQALDGSGHVENKIGSSRYSTEHYLRASLGEYRRANMLETFKKALKDIQYVYPFYFTSISGLQSLTNVDPKRGMRLKDAVITIDCLEALDQRITYLLNLYRKIVWDDVYQRWVVPDMMRYFGMRIYVSEVRLFHTWMPNARKNQENKYTNTIDALNNATYPGKTDVIGAIQNAVAQGTAISNSFLGTQSNITKAVNLVSSTVDAASEVYAGIKDIMNDLLAVDNAINHVMPTICYECHMCEFDISETMSHIDSLDSWNSRKSISPKIKIKVGQVREYQDYPLNRYLQMDNGVYAFDGTINQTVNGKDGKKDVGTRLSDDLLAKRRPEYDETKIAEETKKITTRPSNPSERLNYTTDQSSPKNYQGIEKMKYSPELVTTKTSAMALTTSLLNEGLDTARRFVKDEGAGEVALDHIGRNSTATYPDKKTKSNLNAIKSELNDEERKNAEKNATGIVYEEYVGENDEFVTGTEYGNGKPGERKDLDFEIQDTDIKSAADKHEDDEENSTPIVLYQRTREESIDTLTEKEKKHSDNYRKIFTEESEKYESDTIGTLTESEKEKIDNFSIDIPNTPEKEINNFYITEPDDTDTVTTQTDAERANSSGYKNRFPDSSKSEATQIEEDVIAKSREEYRKSIKEFETQIFDETFGDDSAAMPNAHNIDKLHALKDMLNAALEKIYKGGEIQSMAVSDQMKAKIAEDMFDEFLKDLEMSKATNNKTLKRFLSVYRTLQEEDKYGKSPATMGYESEEFRRSYASAFDKLN